MPVINKNYLSPEQVERFNIDNPHITGYAYIDALSDYAAKWGTVWLPGPETELFSYAIEESNKLQLSWFPVVATYSFVVLFIFEVARALVR